MTQRFTGKVALVTGGTQGIGAAVVRRLAGEGAKVAFCGREAEQGHALVAELGGQEQALFVENDLVQAEACHALVDQAVAAFGRLDIVVNNAASVARGTLADTTVEEFDRMVALNLRAPFLVIQRALPTMQAQFEREGVGGVVVNIGSVNSRIGDAKLPVYSATKGGLVTLSRNLAAALGRWRIRVHVVNPGWVLTEGELVVQRGQGLPDDWHETTGAKMPWGRMTAPDDIAAAVVFFASDEARIFSGIDTVLDQGPL